jgi:hypothetical protein
MIEITTVTSRTSMWMKCAIGTISAAFAYDSLGGKLRRQRWVLC